MTVLLDAGSKSAQATISADGLTLGDLAFDGQGARGNLLITAGKFWFEVFMTVGGSNAGAGCTNDASPNYTDLDRSIDGVVMYPGSGQVWVNNVFIINVEHGAYCMFAIDFTNHKLWIRSSTASFGWNSLSGNPDANTFGVDISGIDAAGLYPLGLVGAPGHTIVFNFGATPPVNTPPSTFSSWDGSYTPAATRHAKHNARAAPFLQNARATAMVTSDTFNLAAIEQRDTCAVEMYSGVGAVMAATEQRDTCHVVPPARYNVGLLNTPKELADDDVIYVLEDNETMYVPADFSDTLVIPEEEIMYAT